MEGKNNNNFISLQNATKLCNYSQEYLSLRARQGKLKAEKIGRNWVTTKEWLQEYLKSAKEYNNITNEKKEKKVAEEKKAVEAFPPESLPVGELKKPVVVQPTFTFDGKKIIKSLTVSFKEIRPAFIAALAFVLIIAGGVFGKESLTQSYNSFSPVIKEADQIKKLAIKEIDDSFLQVYEDVNFFANEFIKLGKPLVNKADQIASDFDQEITSVLKAVGNKEILLADMPTSVTVQEAFSEVLDIFKDYKKWVKSKTFYVWQEIENTTFASSYASANGFLEDKLNNFTYNFHKKYLVLYDFFKDRASRRIESLKGSHLVFSSFFQKKTLIAGDKIFGTYLVVGDFFENVFVSPAKEVSKNYSLANNFIEKKIVQTADNFKNGLFAIDYFFEKKVLQRFSSVSDFYQFFTSPWKIIPGKALVIGKEEFDALKSEVEEFKNNPVIIKRVEVEKVVEPVKEITREIETVKQITKVDDLALSQLRSEIAYLEGEIGKRLYAPGGVVSQTIYVTEPVSSPKIYQENGEIVLQTLGSGNVILSAATGLQLYGQQVVIESTSLLNPLIYLASDTKVGGDLTVDGTITGTITPGSGSITDDMLALDYLPLTGGTLTGTLISTTTQIIVDSGSIALTVTQSGSGYGAIITGGNVGIATSTPSEILSVAGNIMGSGNIVLYGTGTSTFAGPIQLTYAPQTAGENYISDSSLYINATGAVDDANLLGIANAGEWKFRVDEDGDIFTQGNLTTAGSVSQGTTTISNLIVEGHSFLGDAANNDYVIIQGTTTIVADNSNPALTVTQSGSGYGAIITGGNVGIATTSPRYLLDVWGDFSVGTSTDTNTPIFYVDSGDGGRIGIGTTTLSGLFTVGTSTPALVVDSAGNVGIATSTPSESFSVAGNIMGSGNITLYGITTSTFGGPIETTAFKMPTGAVNGYVLTSNTEGYAVWQTLDGGSNWNFVSDTAIAPTSTVGIIVSASSTFTGALSSATSTIGDNDDYVKIGAVNDIPTIYGTGAYLRIGDAGTTSSGLDSEDDLMVSGDFEAKGQIYSTNNIVLTNNYVISSDDANQKLYMQHYADSDSRKPTLNMAATGNYVPVFTIGTGIDWNTDLDWFNGITEPNLAVVDADKDSYITLGHYSDDLAAVRSLSSIALMPSNDIDDYFTFATVGDIPTIYGTGSYLRIGDAGTTSSGLDSEDDLMVTGKLEVDGTAYFSGSGGTQFSTAVKLYDDVPLTLGYGADPSWVDAAFLYETADADALVLVGYMDKNSDANNVPVFIWGDETSNNNDFGFFDGITEPRIAVMDDDADSWISLGHLADDRPAIIASTSNYITLGDTGTATGHSLSSPDDLLIEGKLEVDGSAYFDSAALFDSHIQVNSRVLHFDNIPTTYGNGDAGGTIDWADFAILYRTIDVNARALNFISIMDNADSANNVPVFIFGDHNIYDTDLGFFSGITDPSIAIISDDAGSSARLYVKDGGTFAIQASSTDNALVIDSSGNVGIGTAGPSSKLTVFGGDLVVGDGTATTTITKDTITSGTITDGIFSVTGGAVTGATGNISMWT
ncbi:MAG: hypothetical protein ABH800_01070, partial [Candidatus Nealsonbacteria bacterium]